jgi:phage gp36-like protein
VSAWCTSAQILEQLPDLDTYTDGATDEAAYVARKIAEASDEAKSYLGRYQHFFAAWDAAAPDAVRNAVLAIAIQRITMRRARLMDDPDASPYERDYQRAIAWLRDVSAGKAELAVDWPNREERGGHVAVIAGGSRKAAF